MLSLLLFALVLTAVDEPISEITFEREMCYGPCPVDVAVLRSDGTADDNGKRFTKRVGKHKGNISKEDFATLAKLVDDQKFFDLLPADSRTVTDNATPITTVKRDETPKRVGDYANAAPEELREIERMIIELMEKIEWTKAE